MCEEKESELSLNNKSMNEKVHKVKETVRSVHTNVALHTFFSMHDNYYTYSQFSSESNAERIAASDFYIKILAMYKITLTLSLKLAQVWENRIIYYC